MKNVFYYSLVFCILFFFSCSDNENAELSETVKISMREVGNQLLLANQDSSSLVLPITEVEPGKYRLTFQKKLSIHPDSLVSLITNTFERIKLPNQYRVEVLQCDDNAVAYSYQIRNNQGDTIIPCSGRELPFGCYMVEIRFFNRPNSDVPGEILIYLFGIITIGFVLFGVLKQKKTSKEKTDEHFIKIGRYKFYEVHNKLIKEAEEITLSKKECELLAILVASPNKVVTRDELTKRVWEDNGVIVGRSLDTFISKLRKKLKEDDSVIIENVHGIGYKLVISQ